MGPGKGPIETSYSSANHAVLHAPNGRWGLGTIGTCNSSPKVAVLHAKTRYESWNKVRLVILNLSMLFCMHKSTGEVWVPQRLVIIGAKHAVLFAQINRWGLGPIETINSVGKHAVCMHKSTGEVWDQYRLLILVISHCFACTNPQVRSGTHRDY